MVLEPKFDGYLVAAIGGKLYNVLGEPAPRWLKAALFMAGVAEQVYEMMRDGFAVFLEVYGRRLTPNGYHRKHKRDYDAVVLDIGIVEDGRVRILPPEKAADAADIYGLRYVPYRFEDADVLTDPPMSLAERLPAYQGWEGYVAKVYAAHGHRLPPDYRVKQLGVLMVKARWQSLGNLVVH
ncbi:hypothetical protein Pyrfu_1308 [Pyrolobus fumarii 1A]|uniref:RNA ligase domain-containing protein n=1 Tax=Pyrolobus fumarii (strain DSM 11204 / 1A) TaxID=694429 RepID=G0EGE2_PYRF1|nr:hypothetical protein Pyrfu_1308 [Pyrolobus fumarii 1A]